ncbi:MAG: metalloregulator ArsR/SmtB family transcription factor [Chloroflexi bacterium]|nr:metalloregulator ArsR/SmtB family transcription factor [Chloroflexota bacterium]
MSDITRLKIISLLSQQELSVEQLAEMLGLKSPTVSHHLAVLVKAGLVSARPDSYYNIYRFENEQLEKMSARLLASETLPSVAAEVDMDAYDKKVIRNYSNPDGSLKALPSQRKKMIVILNYVASSFKPGIRYTEKQVNEILARFHEDFVSLRRDLIDIGKLKRDKDGSGYWLNETKQ